MSLLANIGVNKVGFMPLIEELNRRDLKPYGKMQVLLNKWMLLAYSGVLGNTAPYNCCVEPFIAELWSRTHDVISNYKSASPAYECGNMAELLKDISSFTKSRSGFGRDYYKLRYKASEYYDRMYRDVEGSIPNMDHYLKEKVMPMSAFMPFISYITGTVPDVSVTGNDIIGVSIFVPTISVEIFRYSNTNWVNDPDPDPDVQRALTPNEIKSYLYMSFDEMPNLTFPRYIATNNPHYGCGFDTIDFLKQFDWSGKSSSDIIGLLGSCYLGGYMPRPSNRFHQNETIFSICNSIVFDDCPDVVLNMDSPLRSRFVEILHEFQQTYGITIDEQQLMKLVSGNKSQQSRHLYAAIQKLSEGKKLTTEEAYVYTNSVVSKCHLMQQVVSLEAEGPIDAEEGVDTDDDDMIDPGDEVSADDASQEIDNPESETDGETKTITEQEPLSVIIELATGETTLSDYLYRREIIRQVEELIKAPPANVSPDKLLMLKRWMSQWVNTVTIDSIRQFLCRFEYMLNK